MTETVQSAIAARLDALSIPSRIDTDSYPSIVALFEEALSTYRDEAACSSVGHTLTYADLDRLSAQFAGWLQHGAGLERGDRVAVQMPNLIQYLVVCLGALRAGMVVVNTNPLYTERELEHQLNDAGVKVMVAQANVARPGRYGNSRASHHPLRSQLHADLRILDEHQRRNTPLQLVGEVCHHG